MAVPGAVPPQGGRRGWVTYRFMTDEELMALALQQARASLDAGGVPVGAVLAAGGR